MNNITLLEIIYYEDGNEKIIRFCSNVMEKDGLPSSVFENSTYYPRIEGINIDQSLKNDNYDIVEYDDFDFSIANNDGKYTSLALTYFLNSLVRVQHYNIKNKSSSLILIGTIKDLDIDLNKINISVSDRRNFEDVEVLTNLQDRNTTEGIFTKDDTKAPVLYFDYLETRTNKIDIPLLPVKPENDKDEENFIVLDEKKSQPIFKEEDTDITLIDKKRNTKKTPDGKDKAIDVKKREEIKYVEEEAIGDFGSEDLGVSYEVKTKKGIGYSFVLNKHGLHVSRDGKNFSSFLNAEELKGSAEIPVEDIYWYYSARIVVAPDKDGDLFVWVFFYTLRILKIDIENKDIELLKTNLEHRERFEVVFFNEKFYLFGGTKNNLLKRLTSGSSYDDKEQAAAEFVDRGNYKSNDLFSVYSSEDGKTWTKDIDEDPKWRINKHFNLVVFKDKILLISSWGSHLFIYEYKETVGGKLVFEKGESFSLPKQFIPKIEEKKYALEAEAVVHEDVLLVIIGGWIFYNKGYGWKTNNKVNAVKLGLTYVGTSIDVGKRGNYLYSQYHNGLISSWKFLSFGEKLFLFSDKNVLKKEAFRLRPLYTKRLENSKGNLEIAEKHIKITEDYLYRYLDQPQPPDYYPSATWSQEKRQLERDYADKNFWESLVEVYQEKVDRYKDILNSKEIRFELDFKKFNSDYPIWFEISDNQQTGTLKQDMHYQTLYYPIELDETNYKTSFVEYINEYLLYPIFKEKNVLQDTGGLRTPKTTFYFDEGDAKEILETLAEKLHFYIIQDNSGLLQIRYIYHETPEEDIVTVTPDISLKVRRNKENYATEILVKYDYNFVTKEFNKNETFDNDKDRAKKNYNLKDYDKKILVVESWLHAVEGETDEGAVTKVGNYLSRKYTSQRQIVTVKTSQDITNLLLYDIIRISKQINNFAYPRDFEGRIIEIDKEEGLIKIEDIED